MAEAGGALTTTDVAPGTSLLIAGPAMTGKRRLMYDLLSGDGGPDRATTLVTTRKSGDTVAEEYRDAHPEVRDDRLAVVDCVSRERGSTRRDGDTRRFATNPGDLTGAGIHVTEFMRSFHGDDDVSRGALGMHTLSTTLMYADLRRVYQFVHVLTGRVESAGFVGAFVVDTPTTDGALEILKQPFDGLVAVRDAPEGPELRVRGVDVGPRSWTRF